MSDGERAKTARVVLVRHGEGRANVDGVIAGLSGCKGLTELGQRQVEALSNAGGARVSGRMRCGHGPESNFEPCGDAVSRVWNQILQPYDQLRSLTPTADGALNRPAALAEVSGPAAALAVVETLDIGKPCALSWACVEEPARRSM